MIRLNRVRKSFQTEVLRSVTLTIAPGTLYGLIGPGASGKSVLLKIIAGLVRADAGEAWVEGDSLGGLSEISLARVRAKIGMLFQNNALFDYLDVFDNVAFPLRRLFEPPDAEVQRRVSEGLSRVGLGGFESRMPSGLSGGQKKRVGIARATITLPPILLYDEPTAGLDPVTSQRIYDLLRADQRTRGATAVMVSSDVAGLLTVCDRVGMMVRGELVFDGTVDEIHSSNEPVVRQFVRGETEGPL